MWTGARSTYVVADTILAEADRDPLEWRDRQMVHGDREEIERITLTGAAGGPVVLVRRAEGFRIEKPFADRADRELTDGLLSDLTGLTAERFVRRPRHRRGSGPPPPRATVEVAFQGRRRRCASSSGAVAGTGAAARRLRKARRAAS